MKPIVISKEQNMAERKTKTFKQYSKEIREAIAGSPLGERVINAYAELLKYQMDFIQKDPTLRNQAKLEQMFNYLTTSPIIDPDLLSQFANEQLGSAGVIILQEYKQEPDGRTYKHAYVVATHLHKLVENGGPDDVDSWYQKISQQRLGFVPIGSVLNILNHQVPNYYIPTVGQPTNDQGTIIHIVPHWKIRNPQNR